MKKLILLCDYGLDDAVATVCLLDNMHKFSSIDIVPIGGNVPFKRAYKNGMRLLANYGGDLSGVRLIDASSLSHPEEYLPDIHGKDGMGDILDDNLPFTLPVVSYAHFIKEVRPENSLLVSLGPLTVTKKIIDDAGPMELLIMAGNVNETPNYKGYEFNHALDKPAFDYCVKFPHKIATLDTCRVPRFNTSLHLPAEGSGLLYRLQKASLELAEARHKGTCYIYDYIAVQYLISPDSFTSSVERDPDGNLLTMLRSVD